MRDLTQLTRFSDRLSYLYLEKGHIEQDDKSIAYVTDYEKIPIPAADLALLMLGPGTTVSHAAICNLADCNCMVAWTGEQGVRFYSHGRGGTHLGKNTIRQATVWGNQRTRRLVVRRMYNKRFGEELDPKLTIEQIRGREGYRVRTAYQQAAQRYGIEWQGRNYDHRDWNASDPVNRALSTASACLNGLVHAGIISAGYCPALGFVHTGKALSFVYDIADLYKIDYLVPLTFRIASKTQEGIERRVRLACRDLFFEKRLLDRLLPDIEEVLYGCDDTGAGSKEPARRPESLDDRAEGRDIPWPHDRPHPR